MPIILVKIKPGGKSDRICGWLGDVAKIELKAPAIDGRANESLVKYLAKVLELPTGSIHIKSGWTNRQKMLDIKANFSREKLISKMKDASDKKISR